MSQKRRAYYAGPGNRFWKTVFEVGLTPTLFRPQEYRKAIEHGIGFTDLAKYKAGEDSMLEESDFDRDSLLRKIKKYEPQSVAFNGKSAAKRTLGCRALPYGKQKDKIFRSTVFVLPSTSGAARRYWDIRYWHELAVFIERIQSREAVSATEAGMRHPRKTNTGHTEKVT